MTFDTSFRDSERQRGVKRENETYSPVFALPAGTTPDRRTEGSSTCRYENGMYQIFDLEPLDNYIRYKRSKRRLDPFPTAYVRLPRNEQPEDVDQCMQEMHLIAFYGVSKPHLS